jgi:hypothetical protein
MKMYAEEDKGVVFFETVVSMKKQKHTYIECVPVPWDLFDLLPGYFKVGHIRFLVTAILFIQL